MKGTCSCGAQVELVREDGKMSFVNHSCGSRSLGPAKPSDILQRAAAEKAGPRAWCAAKPTEVMWPTGEVVTFPSKTEARVAERLLEEAKKTGDRVYRQVRIPLLSGAAGKKGVPLYLTVDFAVVSGGVVRLIDAKTKRRGREWCRGKAMADAMPGWSVKVEEVDR